MHMGFRVYPYDAAELCDKAYTVKIQGKAVGLHTARVSAHPINRRWPGHQRPQSQTAEMAFPAFSMDESVEIIENPVAPDAPALIRFWGLK